MNNLVGGQDGLLNTLYTLYIPTLLHGTQSNRGLGGLYVLYLSSYEEVQRFLLVPNKAFYLLHIDHHMEQIPPKACLGEVQVIVQPCVQCIQGSDLPSSIRKCCHRCQPISRPRHRALTCAKQTGGCFWSQWEVTVLLLTSLSGSINLIFAARVFTWIIKKQSTGLL